MQKIMLSRAIYFFISIQFFQIFCSDGKSLPAAVVVQQPNKNQLSLEKVFRDEVLQIAEAIQKGHDSSCCFASRIAKQHEGIMKLFYLNRILSRSESLTGFRIDYPASPFTDCGCCLFVNGDPAKMDPQIYLYGQETSQLIINEINRKLDQEYP